ncbi:DUF4037 domain-containing protein [Microlunatus parietis]|uniref:DUF4037 domain-containing protein n=1 Tax=Microlunatus parietis TaxID=682979 RepID=A0A7Y9ID49_9ACTN|nr:DUF4037 domain-containing protein [Microlunatus parietis]NYE74408.1 hypothetical protein [Microlunatus parietis]
MEPYVSGRELSRRLFTEIVGPALADDHPDLAYSAALLGRGSEVLGYDDPLSADHDRQPRVLIFVRDGQPVEPVAATVRRAVPDRFEGFPTDHRVQPLRDYVRGQLGVDQDQEPTVRDWLGLSEQRLLMITAGAVFHDEAGLQQVRDRFAYYPHDVWLYLLSTAWWRVHPEANLVGRTGQVGDELGSALIGADLVRGLIQLCFLIERRYAPYPKWFGTAFARLPGAEILQPLLTAVLRATSWLDREEALIAAYRHVAARQNALGLTEPVPTEIVRLWDRPFRVLWGDFQAALQAEIRDPEVRRLVDRWPAGGIDRVRDVLPGRPDLGPLLD